MPPAADEGVKYVKYGDTLALKALENNGFVSGGGIVDFRLFLEQLSEEIDMPPNLRDCRFQVRNKHQYSAAKSYEKIKNQKSSSSDHDELVAMAHEAFDTENGLNSAEFDRLNGDLITYGTVIQLLHCGSGKFLTLQKFRAEHESSSMRVTLVENGDEGSWWRVNPGYRTHNEGDKIVYSDIAKFESVKYKFQFLNISKAPMNITETHPYVERVFEVNGASSDSPPRFQLIGFSESSKVVPHYETKLRAEDIVAFFHVTKESFLVFDSNTVFFQYATKNSSGQRKLNSNGLWKIEATTADWCGTPVEIEGGFYKVKHLATGKYLAVSEESGLYMSDYYAEVDTLWRFHTIGTKIPPDNKFIKGFHLINLQSFASATFLGEAVRDMANPGCLGADDSQAILADSQQVKDALAPTEANDADLYRLIIVRNSLKQCRRFVSALSALEPFPAIEGELSVQDADAYCKMITQSPLRGIMQSMGSLVITVLTRLVLLATESTNTDPLTREGTADVKYQTVFREQGAANVAMEIVEVLMRDKGMPLWFFDRPQLFQGKLLYINQLCYRFMKQFVKDNMENKRVIAPFVPIMSSHLGPEMKAANTMMEIYKDNVELLRQVSDEQIERFVFLLKQNKRPRFLAFLCALCVCGGAPVPENQNRIIEIMFQQNPDLLLQVETKSYPDGRLAVVLKEVGGTFSFDAGDFMGKADALFLKDTSECTHQELLFLYYLKSMELFRNLCLGRNRGATDFLIGNSENLGLSYKQLLAITAAQKLPYVMRSAACELLQSLFIDREPNEPIAAIRYTRIWSNIIKDVKPKERVLVNPYAAYPDKAPTAEFSDLKAYCLQFYNGMKGTFQLDKPGQNKLTRALLSHSTMLANFGYFHTKEADNSLPVPNFAEIRQCLDCLLDILDGRDDCDSRDPTNLMQRFVADENGLIVMRAKMEICDLMNLFFDFRVERRIVLFLEMYDRIFNTAFPASKNVEMTRYLVDLSLFKSSPVWTEADLISVRTAMFETPIIGKKVAAGNAVLPDIAEVVQVLLDLLRYPLQPLVAKAFALLNRHMGQRSVFITTMLDVQILVFPDISAVYYEALSNVSEIRRQTKWLGSKNEEAKGKAIAAISSILDIFINMCTIGGIVDINGRNLPTDGVNRGKFQTILRNVKALDYIFPILRLPLKRIAREGNLDTTDDLQRRDLFQKCYQFLGVVVADNPPNQKVVFDQRSVFAAHLGIEGINVADPFGATVANNQNILSQVDDRLLFSWFELIRKYGKQARWLRVFSKFLRVGDTFLKRNQTKVLKGLLEFGDSVLSLWLSHDERNYRVDLMEEEEQKTKQMGSYLNYHVTCFTLMAQCCQGKNPDGQAIARTAVSFDTLLDHIVNLEWRFSREPDGTVCMTKGNCQGRDTVRFVKKPLVDLFNFAYVSSSDPKAQQMLLEDKNRFWANDDEEENPQGNQNTFMQEMFTDLLKFATTLETPTDPEVLKEHEDYICFSVMPLLTSYYKNIFLPQVYNLNAATLEQTQLTRGFRVLIQKNIYNKLAIPHRIKAAELLTALTRCEKNEPVWSDVPKEVKESRRSTVSSMTPQDVQRELYKEGLKACIYQLAPLCGVLDMKRMIGVGMRNMAQMFMQNEDPNTGKEMIPHSVPPCNYREVVWRILTAMCSEDRMDHWPPNVALSVLRITRAMVYLEDPNYATRTAEQRDDDWHRYLNNLDMNKSEPSIENLKWVQNKYDRLGLSVVAVCWVAHTDSAVQLAALRLLITMLEGGNNQVQDTLYAYFQRTKDESFFFTCRSIIRRFLDDFKEYRTYLKNVYRQLTYVPAEDEDAEPPVTFELGAIREVVRLVRSLCEGHHTRMQNFVRHQAGNLNSYDLLQDCVNLLESLREYLEESLIVGDSTLFDLCIEACASLSESIQGPCFTNQDALVNTTVVVVADKVFSTIKYAPVTKLQAKANCSPNVLRSQLKQALLQFLLNMLEGIRSPLLPKQIIAMLSFPSLRRQMVMLYKLLNGPRTEADQQVYDSFPVATRDEVIREEAFSYYFIMKYLQSFDFDVQKEQCASLASACTKIRRCGNFCIEHALEDNYPIDTFFRSKAACIEVLRDRRVERVYFRTPENCLKLRANAKWVAMTEYNMFDVERDNAQEKVQIFLGVISNLSFEIQHKTMLMNHPVWRYSMQYRELIEDIPMGLSVLLCMLLYFFYDRFDRPWFGNNALIIFVYVLRLIHCLCAFVFTASWFITEGKIISHARQERLAAIAAENRRLEALQNSAAEESTTVSTKKEELLPYQKKLEDRPALPPPSESNFFKDMMLNSMPYYYMLYFIISVIGVAIYDFPFVYAFHMMDYFRRPEGGLMVVEAITVGGPKLVKTGVMGIILIFFWGVISFTAFHDDLMEVEAQCFTMFQCMSTHLLSGFRGDFDFYGDKTQVVPEQFNRQGHDQGRTLFLIIFFMVWQFLLLNIIIGQIIETFEEIRDAKNTKVEDSEENCFICSEARFTFDQKANGFEHHLKNDHDPWAYLFYLQYLQTKDPIDYNGVESYVAGMVEEASVAWMPINRASALDNAPPDNTTAALNHITQTLETLSESVETRFTSIERAINELKGEAE